MKRPLRLILIATAVAGVVVAACAALPLLIPLSAYKSEFEAAATRATGRDVRIEGPLRITVFPAPGVEADNVTLANVPGGHAAHLAEADSVLAELRLSPLLQGRIEIADIVLTRPRIHLEVDRSGEANWTLTRLHTGQTRGARLPRNLDIDSIAIRDGTVGYANLRSGIARTLNRFDADIALPSAGNTITANGRFDERMTKFTFGARLGDTHALLAGYPAPVAVSLASDILSSNFAGNFARNGDTDGVLKFETPSLLELAARFGHPIVVAGGLGHLVLRAHVERRPHLTSLTDASLKLDAMTINGKIAIATDSKLPALTGRLDIDHLDLNPYLGLQHHREGPHEQGWSTKPIPLGLLKSIDADLALDAGSLDVRHLHLDRVKLAVTLKGAKLTADLPDVALYGGTGHAHLVVDDSGPSPTFENRLEIDHFAAKPFLADTLGVERIEGTAALKFDVTSRGDTPDAIMHGLSGSGSIALADGRVRGVNLGEIAHTVEEVLRGSAVSDAALTSFNSMGGSFGLRDGALETDDFHLSNAVLRMTGAGVVDLGGRTLDVRIVPRAVLQQPDPDAPDYGGNANGALGVPVPFQIKGPWDRIRYTPDLSNVVSGVLRNLERGRAPFKDMFGHTENRNDGGKKHKSIGDEIKNMLGIH